jgi:hypothetical protein
MTGLDNYEKLKIATYELMQERTDYLEKSEHERLLEEKDDSHTDNPSEDGAEHVDDPVLDTDDYYGYVAYFGWK